MTEATLCLLSYLRFKRQERSYAGDYETARAVDTALFKGYGAAGSVMLVVHFVTILSLLV